NYRFFFQAEDSIRYRNVTGVQTCALPIFFGSDFCDQCTDSETREGGNTFMKRKVYIVLGVIGVLLVIGFVGKFIKDASSYGTSGNTSDEKPVIYLYPEQEQEISVRLNY